MNDLAREQRDLDHLSALATEAYPYAAPSLAVIANSDPSELNTALLQAHSKNYRSQLAAETSQFEVQINQDFGNYEAVERARRELGQHLDDEAASRKSAAFAQYVLDTRERLTLPARRVAGLVTAFACAVTLGGSTYLIETTKGDPNANPSQQPNTPELQAQAKPKDINEGNIAISAATGLVLGGFAGYGFIGEKIGKRAARNRARRQIERQEQRRLAREA